LLSLLLNIISSASHFDEDDDELELEEEDEDELEEEDELEDDEEEDELEDEEEDELEEEDDSEEASLLSCTFANLNTFLPFNFVTFLALPKGKFGPKFL